MVLIQLFAQAPINLDGHGEGEGKGGEGEGGAATTVVRHVRAALAKLSKKGRGRGVGSGGREGSGGGDGSSSTSASASSLVVELNAAQRLPLGEALVLAIRRSGEATPHYAPLFLLALVTGAAPAPASVETETETTSTNAALRREELLAAAALRASCFSGTDTSEVVLSIHSTIVLYVGAHFQP